MRPFLISEKFKHLREQYPTSLCLREAVTGIRRLDLLSVLRLWLTEGIPFAFKDSPMLYESVREWIAMRLQVHPKAITLIGSGRIGYSLRPLPVFGRDFNAKSDLDFSVVDQPLFSRVVSTFVVWESDVTDGRAAPRNAREKRFWDDTLKRMPDKIERGFIDPELIPTLIKYHDVVTILDTLYLLKAKLQVTAGGPSIRKATLRVYRDWSAFFGQMSLNMSHTLASFAEETE